jgi:hypothetical protein
MAMRKGLLAVLATWATATAVARAQAEAPLVMGPLPEPDAPVAVETSPFTVVGPEANRLWASCGYMIWRLENGPLHTPLVTTSSDNPLTPQSGQLGQAGTRILFGSANLDYGTFSGLTAVLGGWLDAEQDFGAEVSGFVLERRSTVFRASSDGTGVPLLVIPYQSAAGTESGVIVASPAVGMVPAMIGAIAVTSSSRLWGTEANGIMPLFSRSGFTAELLAGLRHAELDESLGIVGTSTFDVPSVGSMGIAQADSFSTQNLFLGGQVGSRVNCTVGRLSMDLLGKVALGATHQVLNVGGISATTGMAGLAPPLADGGIFAQPSNSGHFTHDELSVMPEMQFKVDYGLTSSLHTYVSYSFLYWTSVARPGDQLDRVVNTSQNQVLLGPGTLSGPARPTAQINPSDLFAHGISLGVQWDW